MAAKQKKLGLTVTKPLACCTDSDTKRECTPAPQQPDSPVTQAGSIESTMQPCCSSAMADFAEDSVCQLNGTVYPVADLKGKSPQQQTGSKHVRALLRQNDGCERKQLSSNVDMSASCPLPSLTCCEREAGTARTTVKGCPRSSSWQRRRAAKLRQAQQDNKQGKLSCLIHVTDAYITVYTTYSQQLVAKDSQCVLLRPVQGHIGRGRSFRAAAACQAAALACNTAISS